MMRKSNVPGMWVTIYHHLWKYLTGFWTSFISLCHLPLIASLSALLVIIMATRTRSNTQKIRPFKEHLREQLYRHKHLFISPCIPIVLAVPRLVISFLSGCMKSGRDSWFYLIVYFMSFIPSIMTFIVFVLPSKVYKKEFNETMKRIWQR